MAKMNEAAAPVQASARSALVSLILVRAYYLAQKRVVQIKISQVADVDFFDNLGLIQI